ncbi:hypothetical protein V1478_005092 [Vespula squamosa]|uniref:Uncharacterized protein n=1 Tax=Vespula squamosa TaxID=30214 RepID=A0ABD2BDB8_VESSQ
MVTPGITAIEHPYVLKV